MSDSQRTGFAGGSAQQHLVEQLQAAVDQKQEAVSHRSAKMQDLQQSNGSSAAELQAALRKQHRLSELLKEANSRHWQTSCLAAREQDMQQLRLHRETQQGLQTHSLQALQKQVQAAQELKQDALA